MPSWQSTSRIGCLINNLARRSRGAISPTRLQWTRVPLDFRPRWRYVVNKAGAANAAPALKYKFYFTPHFCGYTEFGMVPQIGLKIAYYRKLQGYTQEKLADKLGVATPYIGQIEAAGMYKPISLTTLLRIAQALDTPVYKFLDFQH